MEFLSSFLPILLYIVAIVLIIVFIIVGIKLIYVLDKADKLVDNLEEKVNSFNGALAVINRAADGFASIGDSVLDGVGLVSSKVVNLFKNRSKKKMKKEEDIYE